MSQNVDPPHAVSDPEKCNYKAMIRHDSRTATVVLWEIAGKKVLTAKSSSSSRAQASLDLAWPWKPCIVHNHSFAATAPKRLDLKTPQSDVCAWFGKSPMAQTLRTAHLLSKSTKGKNHDKQQIIIQSYSVIIWKPNIVACGTDQSCAFWINYDIAPMKPVECGLFWNASLAAWLAYSSWKRYCPGN